MQDYSREYTNEKRYFLVKPVGVEGKSHRYAYYGAGYTVQQCGAQKAQIARQKPNCAFTKGKRLYEEKRIFKRSEA